MFKFKGVLNLEILPLVHQDGGHKWVKTFDIVASALVYVYIVQEPSTSSDESIEFKVIFVRGLNHDGKKIVSVIPIIVSKQDLGTSNRIVNPINHEHVAW
jgi:hypothetical protein